MARGKTFKVAWQEDAATLKHAYQRESVAAVRTRLHALWLLREDKTMSEVAALLAVHYDTVQSWVRWYRQGGLPEVRRHLVGGRQGRKPLLSGEQQQQLEVQSERGEFRQAADVASYLERQFGVCYSKRGLYSLLARRRIVKKRPRPQHLKADPVAQAGWKKGV